MPSSEPPASPEAGALYVVSVRDTVNPELAEHAGVAYDSPPQPREQALTLIALLRGGAEPPRNGAARWMYAIAGGRRTIELAAAPTLDARPAGGAPRRPE